MQTRALHMLPDVSAFMFVKGATNIEPGMIPHTIVFQVNASILMMRPLYGNAGHVRPEEGSNITGTHGYLESADGPFLQHLSLPPVPLVLKERVVIHESLVELQGKSPTLCLTSRTVPMQMLRLQPGHLHQLTNHRTQEVPRQVQGQQLDQSQSQLYLHPSKHHMKRQRLHHEELLQDWRNQDPVTGRRSTLVLRSKYCDTGAPQLASRSCASCI